MTSKSYVVFVCLFFTNLITTGQCLIDTTFLGADTTVCNGQSVNLTAFTGLTYDWSNGDSVDNITVNSPGVYACTVTTQDSTNLILNGDFSLGDTLFTSGHVYGTGGSWGLLSNAGQYAISTNANLTHNNFPNCTDHTSGTGNYMIVNGSTTANLTVWCQTITVSPNTSYVFSAWLTSVVSGSPAILSFTADGVSMGSNVNLTSTTCSWQNFYQIWTSGPTQTSVSICLTNQNTQGGGNDFGLDDLFFAEICTNTDSINITHVGPTVNLGNDTTICTGDSILLNAFNPGASSYNWSNGNNTASQYISNPQTNFSVTVTQNGCTDTDQINISVLGPPIVNLGNDTTLCAGSFLYKSIASPQASYLWSTGATSANLFLNQDTTYWVEATNMCGTNSDTLILSLVQPLSPNLGNDTTLCNNATMNLSTNIMADAYAWNTGSVTNSTLVNQAQTYILTVTNLCGNFTDSVVVNYEQTPTVNLGIDHHGCITAPVVLDAYINGTVAYLWNTGSTSSQITANATNTFWVQLSNNCGVASDTVQVVYDTPMYFNLGVDTTICAGDSISLTPTVANGSFTWNTGATDSSITVSNAGNYWVTATNFCGSFSDSIAVFMESPPQIFGPTADAIKCAGEIYQVNIPQGNASQILWSDGSTNWSNSFHTTGNYFYQIQNLCGTDSDSFQLIIETPATFNLGNDTTICAGEVIEKSFSFGAHQYLWNDGNTDSVRFITAPGVYALTIYTPAGCESTDAFHVSMCPTQLFIPNAFTPQTGDQLNNYFVIEGIGVERFHLAIYDRWGMLVFESFNLQHSWDGTVSGKLCEPGIYNYKIWYNTGESPKSISKVGTVHLLR